jgi:hypothetical protein
MIRLTFCCAINILDEMAPSDVHFSSLNEKEKEKEKEIETTTTRR